MNADILVVGIGGQGVMTAAEILARTALGAGLDVTKTEVAGMSQRGGVVCSQVRIATKVHACEIAKGSADLLIALEPAEALRWAPWLALHGAVVVNITRAVPPVVSSGLHQYPADPIAGLRALGHATQAIDATQRAADLGDARLLSTVMLGAAAAHLPFAPAALREQLALRFRANPRVSQLNAQAFDRGLHGMH